MSSRAVQLLSYIEDWVEEDTTSEYLIVLIWIHDQNL